MVGQVAASDTDFHFLCFSLVSFLGALWLVSAFLYSVAPIIFRRGPLKDVLKGVGSVFMIFLSPFGALFKLARRPRTALAGIRIGIRHPRLALGRLLRPQSLHFVFAAVLVAIWLFLLTLVLYRTLSFDAHKILEVSRTASMAEIKRAFRQKSILYHPDKNASPDAAEMFRLVMKAYKKLVDPESFEQEEKAAGVGKAGVALPEFLMRRENGLIIMAGFVVLIFLPLCYLVYRLSRSPSSELRGCRRRLGTLLADLPFLLRDRGMPPASSDNTPQTAELPPSLHFQVDAAVFFMDQWQRDLERVRIMVEQLFAQNQLHARFSNNANFRHFMQQYVQVLQLLEALRREGSFSRANTANLRGAEVIAMKYGRQAMEDLEGAASHLEMLGPGMGMGGPMRHQMAGRRPVPGRGARGGVVERES